MLRTPDYGEKLFLDVIITQPIQPPRSMGVDIETSGSRDPILKFCRAILALVETIAPSWGRVVAS